MRRNSAANIPSKLILLLGLNWGGVSYPWASAHVIATIVVGFVALGLFVAWESFMKLQEPLVPMHLFRNVPWNAASILSALGASIYYAFAVVWPQMVSILYADSSSPITTAWVASVAGIGWVAGVISGGFFARALTHVKWQCLISTLCGGVFFASKCRRPSLRGLILGVFC